MEKTINKVELTGYVGQTPELKTLQNGNTLLRLSVATSESYKTRDGEWMRDTTWHNVVLWKEQALKGSEIIKKGSRITLTGKLVTRKYVGRDGRTNYATEVVAFICEPVID